MARIKGKWVGQVVIEVDYDENDDLLPFDMMKRRFKAEYADLLKRIVEEKVDEDTTVTVTQLHADLYRDEPSEWTKEEVT